MTEFYNQFPRKPGKNIPVTDSTIYSPGQPFYLNGTSYPGNWLANATEAQILALGFSEVTYGPCPNEQFYTVTRVQKQNKITYVGVAKPLQGCKDGMIAQAKGATHTAMSATDYYTYSDRPTPMPQDVADHRQAQRDNCDAYVSAVNACADVDALAALPPFVVI